MKFKHLFFVVTFMLLGQIVSAQKKVQKPPKKVICQVPVLLMAKFPGGEDSLIRYFSNNINYPEGAKEKGIRGEVLVSFVIDIKGRVTEAKIVRDIGGGCGEEALRVVNSMPLWKPGMEDGKPIASAFHLPLLFMPEEEKSK